VDKKIEQGIANIQFPEPDLSHYATLAQFQQAMSDIPIVPNLSL
jgi:hypothetical protein